MKSTALVYCCLFFLFEGVAAYTSVPVKIEDTAYLKLNPKLEISSSFVYNDTIYVYGGYHNSLSWNISTTLYKYEFIESNGTLELSTVKTTNEGPKCIGCSPIHIPGTTLFYVLCNDQELIDTFNDAYLETSYFQPFVFDFSSMSWLNLTDSVTYNNGLRGSEAFRYRVGHAPVLIQNRIYIIGGNKAVGPSAYCDSCARSVLYYDISKNSFNVLDNDLSHCLYYPNAFASSDEEISVLFGATDADPQNTTVRNNNVYGYMDTMYYAETYIPSSYVYVLNVTSSSWLTYNTTRYPGPRYGSTTRYDPSTSLAYVFGGVSKYKSYAAIRDNHIYVFNATSRVWINKYSSPSIHPRSWVASVLLKNEYFITFYGTTTNFKYDTTTPEINIFNITSGKLLNDPQDKMTLLLSGPPHMDLSIKYAIVMLILLSFIIFYIMLVIIAKHLNLVDSVGPTLLRVLYDRRNGEPVWTEMLRMIVKFISFVILCLFAVYCYNNIAESTISTTSDIFAVPNMTYPDVRVCFTDASFDPTTRFIICEVDGESENSDCSGSIVFLDTAIHSPLLEASFTNVQCFMFTSNTTLVATESNPSISFFVNPNALREDSNIYITTYSPTSNPNRHLFLEGDNATKLPDGWGFEDLQYWDAEGDTTVYQGDESTSIDLNDNVVISFKTTLYNTVDASKAWNYIGGDLFPSYVPTSNLTVAYNRKANVADGAVIQLKPVSFNQETITEKRDNTILGALATAGGILGLLTTIQVIIFGSRPVSPWGLIHTITRPVHSEMLSQTLDYQFFNKNTDEPPLIPLVDPISPQYKSSFRELNNNQYIETGGSTNLEARIQMLEVVLKSYYIDEQIFQSLKNGRQKVRLDYMDEEDIIAKEALVHIEKQ